VISGAGLLLAMTVRVFHVDHALPGDAPAIADAAVAIDGETGEVLDVGRARDVLPRHEGAPIERVRGVALPGLVNAHTHLELSALRGRVPGGRGFVSWVDGLIAARTESTEEDDLGAIEAACDELAAGGTVAVGEVTNTLRAVAPLARRGIGGCVFHEVFGQDRDAVLRRVQGLRSELDERVPTWPTRDLTYAPAPHTLYTTHADAVRALLDGAKKHGTRTSVHLAEHAGERRAIEAGDGPVPAWLASRTKHAPAWPMTPLLDYAEALGALGPSVLLVHVTDARPDELARVAASGAPVVLCPRSNLFIEVRLPPLFAMREAGIEPALGTDSLASNASLDVLAEARALHDRFPPVPAVELVRMATWNGARALGRPDLGRLARGARPGLVAIEGDAKDDPARFVLANVKAPRRILARRAPHVAPSIGAEERGS
jgi:cytosine/adenosine deaminase-related metal-dependent hydrolase